MLTSDAASAGSPQVTETSMKSLLAPALTPNSPDSVPTGLVAPPSVPVAIDSGRWAASRSTGVERMISAWVLR